MIEHKVSEWPMLMHDPGNTSCDGSLIRPPLFEVWKFKAKDRITSPPIPAYGMVFFSCKDGRIYALDAHTGQLRWTFNIRKKIESSPIVANNTVLLHRTDTCTQSMQKKEC
ncbi:MAG: hypothetical protein DRJ38_05260 [Thermoprotei archaeon]|nr:MAG: hypothetical protein DRJ38_05260 [Thermoprotei archaeon]